MIILHSNEEIKPIIRYEGLYSITSFGRVYSHEKQKGCVWKEGSFLKNNLNKDGYLYFSLCKNNKIKSYKVHRLVAIAFIENPKNLPEVNHKDGNKQNNYVGTAAENYIGGNLEWCTNQENHNHAIKNKLYTHKYHSGYYGVSYYKDLGHKNEPWFARITVNKKLTYIGSFKTEIEAAIAYNKYVVNRGLNRLLNIL